MSDGYLSPKWILTEFLRKNLTDPRTTRTETSTAQAFTPDGVTTAFTLTTGTGGIHYIDSVTIDGNDQDKWFDYWIDFQNERIVFFTAPTGTAGTINFVRKANQWIFPDKPVGVLDDDKFPRIDLWNVAGTAQRIGNVDAPVWRNLRIQFDVWAKEKQNGQVFTISQGGDFGDIKLSGEHLTEYLAYQLEKAFEDNESDIFPALDGWSPIGQRDMPFNTELQCHHKVVEAFISGLKVGRVTA